MFLRSLFMSVVILVAATAGHATTLIKLDFDQLAQRSDSIVVGKVDSVAYQGPEATGSYPKTLTRFTVDEVLLGEDVREVTVMTIGGPAGNGLVTVVPGMPRFKADEKAVLFLVRDKKNQTSIPTGLNQGVFRIKTDPDTKAEYILNQSVDLRVRTLLTGDEVDSSKTKVEKLDVRDFKKAIRAKVAEKRKK